MLLPTQGTAEVGGATSFGLDQRETNADQAQAAAVFGTTSERANFSAACTALHEQRRRAGTTPAAMALCRAFIFGPAFNAKAFLAEFTADVLHQGARAQRLQSCGDHAFIWLDRDTRRGRLITQTCKDRFCPRCRVTRAGVVAAAVGGFMESKKASFITLTQKIDQRPLAETIDHLFGSFRRLRERDDWNVRVKGGIGFVETKWSASSRGWHTHLHTICECPFYPWRVLSEQWRDCSNGSYIVDVKPVTSGPGAARYVAGYAGKALDASIFSDRARLEEAMKAFAHRRQFMSFGCWHGKSVTKIVPPKRDSIPLDSLASVIMDVQSGNAGSLATLALLCGGEKQARERLRQAETIVGIK